MNQEKPVRSARWLPYILIPLLVALFALAALKLSFGRPDGLYGSWALESGAVYTFDGREAGTLTVPLGTYEYSYLARDGRLSLDFADPDASDAIYLYSVSDGVLTLDQDGTLYTLTRLPD